MLTVNVSEKAVAFRVFNTRLESYDYQGGSPDAYNAPTLRNVVAYFYNIAVKGEKAPAKPSRPTPTTTLARKKSPIIPASRPAETASAAGHDRLVGHVSTCPSPLGLRAR